MTPALPLGDHGELADAAHLVPMEKPRETAALLAELVGAGMFVCD